MKNLSESGEILNEEQVKALIKEQVDGGTGGGYYGSYELTLAADEWKPPAARVITKKRWRYGLLPVHL